MAWHFGLLYIIYITYVQGDISLTSMVIRGMTVKRLLLKMTKGKKRKFNSLKGDQGLNSVKMHFFWGGEIKMHLISACILLDKT